MYITRMYTTPYLHDLMYIIEVYRAYQTYLFIRISKLPHFSHFSIFISQRYQTMNCHHLGGDFVGGGILI